MMKRAILFASVISMFAGAAYASDLNVASVTANVPFEFEDGSGNLVGFEVDLVNLIGERTGKKINYTQMPFNSIFATVQSGRADIAIGTVTITDKRLESVAFTQPYYDADACLTTSSNGDVKSLKDLNGKVLAVVTGTTGEMWATENKDKYGITEINRYDGVSEPMLDIATGRVAAFVHDCPIDAYYIKDKPQYAIVDTIPTNEQFAIMLAKDSPLLPELNAVISKLKEDGEIARIHEKWFGSAPAKDSSTVEVRPIPGK